MYLIDKFLMIWHGTHIYCCKLGYGVLHLVISMYVWMYWVDIVGFYKWVRNALISRCEYNVGTLSDLALVCIWFNLESGPKIQGKLCTVAGSRQQYCSLFFPISETYSQTLKMIMIHGWPHHSFTSQNWACFVNGGSSKIQTQSWKFLVLRIFCGG